MVGKAGNVAVVLQQGLLQLVDVGAHFPGLAAVLDGQRRGSTGSLTAHRAGSHDTGGAERGFGGADIPAGHHQIRHVLAVEAAVGNGVAAVIIQNPAGYFIEVENTFDSVLIHLPPAVCHGVIKDAVCANVVFIQQIVALQTAAFPVAGHHTHPIQIQIVDAMVALIFQMIPHTVNAFDQFVPDVLSLADDVVPVAADLNPPVAVVHVGKMGQTAGAFLKRDQRATIGVGADGIAVLPVFELLFGKGVGPFRLFKDDLFTPVNGAEHHGIAHGVGVGHIGRVRLVEFRPAFGAQTAAAPGHHTQRAVSRGIDEDFAAEPDLGFRGVLVADDGLNAAILHHYVIHVGIQIGVQILLIPDGFPENGVKNREGSIGIAALVFQQHFHQDAGFGQVGLGGMGAGAHNMHPDFRAGVSAEYAPVLDNGGFCAVPGGSNGGAHPAETAADNNNLIGF